MVINLLYIFKVYFKNKKRKMETYIVYVFVDNTLTDMFVKSVGTIVGSGHGHNI